MPAATFMLLLPQRCKGGAFWLQAATRLPASLMKIILLLPYLLAAHVAWGQPQTLPVLAVPIRPEANPYFADKQSLTKKLSLATLQTTNDLFHFRLWTDAQALDIWTADYTAYAGRVTNYAQRYDSKLLSQGRHQVDSVFSTSIPLDSSKARQLFRLVQALAIAAIPSDDAIPGWSDGLDGEEYAIELMQKGKYSFKSYWSPRLFADSIPEAKRIQTLLDTLYNVYNLHSYSQSLKTPPGSYAHNGVSGVQIQVIPEQKTHKTSIWDWF